MKISEMTSYRVTQCENLANSNSFNSNAYINLLLHPRVRTLMLYHNQEETKEEFGDYKAIRPSLYTQRREASKGENKVNRVALGNTVDNRKEKELLCLAEHQPSTSRSDWRVDQERRNTSNRRRESLQERIEFLTDSNRASIHSAHRRSLSLDRRGEDVQERINFSNRRRGFHQERITAPTDADIPSFQRAPRRPLSKDRKIQDSQERINVSTQEEELHQESEEMFCRTNLRYRSLDSESKDSFFMETVMKYRDLLNHYEARRKRRQGQRLAVEYGPTLPMDTQATTQIRNDRNKHFNDRGLNKVTSENCTEEVERLCKRVREHVSKIRYRMNSSQALSARNDIDPDIGWEELEDRNTLENGWTDFSSKIYREAFQDPGDLPSLTIPKGIEPSEKSFKSEEIENKMQHQDTSVNKIDTDYTAFDPFPSTVAKSIAWEHAPWRDSNFSSETPDVGKSTCFSKDESGTRDIADTSVEAETISSIEKVQTNANSSGKSLKSKEIGILYLLKTISEIHKVLICTNKSEKSFEKHSGQQSQATAESSSCATPTTANCDDSRNRSKIQEGFKKKEKARRRFSSFSKATASNKEWLLTSVGPEGDLTRKRDIEMQKWLSAGVVQDWKIDQESVSKCGGPMEMVFYDTSTSSPRAENFKNQ